MFKPVNDKEFLEYFSEKRLYYITSTETIYLKITHKTETRVGFKLSWSGEVLKGHGYDYMDLKDIVYKFNKHCIENGEVREAFNKWCIKKSLSKLINNT